MDKKEFQIQVGSRIRELRLEKEISQQRLASECDFDKSNMARIEAGRSNITIGTLNKIVLALDVSLHQFFNKKDFS